jgi:hypothetical protein
MLITKYFYFISNDPLSRFPPRLRVAASAEQGKGERLYMTLLPLWGKVGKGVINIHLIIVLFMIPDTHINL